MNQANNATTSSKPIGQSAKHTQNQINSIRSTANLVKHTTQFKQKSSNNHTNINNTHCGFSENSTRKFNKSSRIRNRAIQNHKNNSIETQQNKYNL